MKQPHWGRKTVALAATLAISTILMAPPTAGQEPLATTIVGRMGTLMSETNARHGIGFRPFAPPRRIIAVALLPPFHGDDLRRNRGIGFEYVGVGKQRFALAQWPANGRDIDHYGPPAIATTRCTSARNFVRGDGPNGIVWSTPHGLIMTLQADGKSDARMVGEEWQKLVRRGACS